MDAFVQRLLDTPPPSAETERVLARRAQDGDARARDELVTRAMRSVVLHALMLGARGEALREAVQAGAVALTRAVDGFDPERGVRLGTYAWPWIRGAVLAELRTTRDTAQEPPEPVSDDASSWLDGLPPEVSRVVRLRFGIGAETEPMSRPAVAATLALSVSQVRRIEAEAMRRLRAGVGSIDSRASRRSAPVPHSSIGRAFDC